MSIVILGGNNCMERQYKQLCRSYDCEAKVFIRADGGLKRRLGDPDLVIFFTRTMSHKMVAGALCELKGRKAAIERCHSSSISALKGILDKYMPEGPLCPTSY